MEQKGPTDSLTGNRYQKIANHSSDVVAPDYTSQAVERAKALLHDIDASMKHHLSTTQPKPQNEHQWIISLLWVLNISALNNLVLNIEDLVTYIATLKDTDLHTKLEIDLMTMNVILHQIHDHLQLIQLFLRIVDKKYTDFRHNQMQRFMTYILDEGEYLQHSARNFMQSFVSAVGQTSAAADLTTHLKTSLTNASKILKLVRMFRNHIIQPINQKFKMLAKSAMGRNVASWACGILKELAPAPVALGLDILRKAVQQSPLPVSEWGQYSHISDEAHHQTPGIKEFGTLARPTGLKMIEEGL